MDKMSSGFWRLLKGITVIIAIFFTMWLLVGCGLKVPFPSRIPIPKIPIGWP
jgi:hypothetical protein